MEVNGKQSTNEKKAWDFVENICKYILWVNIW
jgi:hypothetical protein